MAQKYLKQRDSMLHVRKRVPLDLIPLVGRTEIHCSLKTGDQRQAKDLARTILTNLETGFLTLRQQRLLNMPEESLREAAQILICDRLPSSPRPRLASVRFTASAPEAKSKPLSELIETFISDRKSGWEPKTLMMRSAALALFVQIVGDKPIAELTRDECRSFRDTLAKLPPNMTKRFKGLSITEVLARSPAPMSVTNVNKYLTTVGAFLNWAVEEKALTENPARGLKLANKNHPDTERDAYSPDDLKLLFEQSPLYVGCASRRKRHVPGPTIIRDAKWWLPLISVYSGMCLEEIAQLGIQDIRQEQGIWCFDVNAEDERKLKTDYRPRLVPVHPKLIELGLLKHAEKIRAEKRLRLWPELEQGADGFYGSAYSKWFGRYKRKIGISNPKLTFHSFRHTVINHLKQKAFEEAWIKELVGHANESITTGRYGKRLELPKLQKIVDALDYDVNHR